MLGIFTSRPAFVRPSCRSLVGGLLLLLATAATSARAYVFNQVPSGLSGTDDNFGFSVSSLNTYLAVGVPQCFFHYPGAGVVKGPGAPASGSTAGWSPPETHGSGLVLFYNCQSGTCVQEQDVSPPSSSDACFGASVSLTNGGSTLFVGSPAYDASDSEQNSGIVIGYYGCGTDNSCTYWGSWASSSASDLLGFSLSSQGVGFIWPYYYTTWFVSGAPGAGSSPNIYGSFMIGVISASGTAKSYVSFPSGLYGGMSISSYYNSGSQFIFAASTSYYSGSVLAGAFLYYCSVSGSSNPSCTQSTRISISGSSISSTSVTLSSNYLAVGAFQTSSLTGIVYVYPCSLSGSTPSCTASSANALNSLNPINNGYFGYQMDSANTILAVAAPGETAANIYLYSCSTASTCVSIGVVQASQVGLTNTAGVGAGLCVNGSASASDISIAFGAPFVSSYLGVAYRVYGSTVQTSTQSATESVTRSATASATASLTASQTASLTGSATGTRTRSATASLTASWTGSATGTQTRSGTASATNSVTNSLTQSPTASYTQPATASLTLSATASFTPSPTASATASFSQSGTVSFSQSGTATFTQSATASFTESATATATDSSTQSATASLTESATASLTESATASLTESASNSFTQSGTDSFTLSATASLTQSATDSFTLSATDSFTLSVTDSFTLSATDSFTLSATDSFTLSATDSFTLSASDSFTESATNSYTQPATASFTLSSTDSFTDSATASYTESATASFTQSATNSFTLSATASYTESATASYTESATASLTRSASASYTESATGTFTRTSTASSTQSASASFTESSTQSATQSATESSTQSATQSATESSSASFTQSATGSYTESATGSYTESATASFTESSTQSATEPATVSFTQSATASFTESSTASFTESSTASFTESATASFTETFSATASATATPLAASHLVYFNSHLPSGSGYQPAVQVSLPVSAGSKRTNLAYELILTAPLVGCSNPGFYIAELDLPNWLALGQIDQLGVQFVSFNASVPNELVYVDGPSCNPAAQDNYYVGITPPPGAVFLLSSPNGCNGSLTVNFDGRVGDQSVDCNDFVFPTGSAVFPTVITTPSAPMGNASPYPYYLIPLIIGLVLLLLLCCLLCLLICLCNRRRSRQRREQLNSIEIRNTNKEVFLDEAAFMGDSGLALWNDAKTNAEQTPAAGPIVEPSDTAQSTTTDSLATDGNSIYYNEKTVPITGTYELHDNLPSSSSVDTRPELDGHLDSFMDTAYDLKANSYFGNGARRDMTDPELSASAIIVPAPLNEHGEEGEEQQGKVRLQQVTTTATAATEPSSTGTPKSKLESTPSSPFFGTLNRIRSFFISPLSDEGDADDDAAAASSSAEAVATSSTTASPSSPKAAPAASARTTNRGLFFSSSSSNAGPVPLPTNAVPARKSTKPQMKPASRTINYAAPSRSSTIKSTASTAVPSTSSASASASASNAVIQMDEI